MSEFQVIDPVDLVKIDRGATILLIPLGSYLSIREFPGSLFVGWDEIGWMDVKYEAKLSTEVKGDILPSTLLVIRKEANIKEELDFIIKKLKEKAPKEGSIYFWRYTGQTEEIGVFLRIRNYYK